MKNRIGILFLITLFLFSFSSCLTESLSAIFGQKGEVEDTGTVTLVLAQDENAPTVYTQALSDVEGDEGLFSVLDALKIPYVEKDGFLKQVGDVEEDAGRGVYVILWTSVEADADTSGWIENRVYDGRTLYPSLVGGKDMTVKDGAVLYVGTVVYTW